MGNSSEDLAHQKTLLRTAFLLFFLLGLSANLILALVAFMQDLLSLQYSKAMYILLSSHGAFFFSCPLSGLAISRYGYNKVIRVGTIFASLGCFILAATIDRKIFGLLLLGTGVLGVGMSNLIVAINPLVFQLGKKSEALSRLSLAHFFAALGMLGAPFIASFFLNIPLNGIQDGFYQLDILYCIIGSLWLLAYICLFYCCPKDLTAKKTGPSKEIWKNILASPGLLPCFMALFVYVGCEVSIGCFLIDYMQDPKTQALPLTFATKYTTIYWGGLMIGRLIGARALLNYSPAKILLRHATVGIILLSLSLYLKAPTPTFLLLATGLVNSIMYPAIFSLGMGKTPTDNATISSILCMANIGGSMLPFLQGIVADLWGITNSFVVPLGAYAVIFSYASVFFLKNQTKKF
ncbi:MAG: FHS family L-fucose permease-like MFS transporter [Chlamydiales bacterium]|jgi:FHS family L-fucose permease-like MFS transporter